MRVLLTPCTPIAWYAEWVPISAAWATGNTRAQPTDPTLFPGASLAPLVKAVAYAA